MNKVLILIMISSVCLTVTLARSKIDSKEFSAQNEFDGNMWRFSPWPFNKLCSLVSAKKINPDLNLISSNKYLFTYVRGNYLLALNLTLL